MTQSRVSTQFFYQNDKLISLVQPGANRTLFRGEGVPLAELAPDDDSGNVQLLVTDQQQSVLGVSGESQD
ncbi:hypothetical protein [Pseudomonas sp. UBA6562]|uniref:hypothetical protein n=1 Tax=Pseudomonas sp. UBA6562 TaxID=1947332 RepID=UPI0025F81C8D|nr:hypothetical protein [Pseudomonas sp. UBA6562]